jgi:predicted GIY-YIG superfamily endonuclease
VSGSTETTSFADLPQNTASNFWFGMKLTSLVNQAFAPEHQIKKWNRGWKLELIEKDNPSWRDLGDEISI